MIVVRDVFQLRFGMAREAVALWQEGVGFIRSVPGVKDVRMLTDLAGPYYTLVLESGHDSLGGLEEEMRGMSADPKWRAWYARFTPLVDRGHRELFTVVGSTVPPLAATLDRPSAALNPTH